jgi:aspartyl-tRNA(Asn)/glutamyl-tRNA(Gln) amidotransferase subunit A
MTRPAPAQPLAAAVRAGERSAEEVVSASLDRLRARRGLGAVLHVDEQGALERARELDLRRRRGQALGPLAGVPVAVKDTICTKGLPTTCGSRLLEGWRAPYDATAVRRLRDAGAVIVAKTACDEFGMGSSTERCAFGPAHHPLDTGRVPGGSSGGSAVAVADGQVPIALGSDTGGSVRQPAALCGVVGFKPTYGRVSRYGLVAYASSLDQIGPLTRTVEDAAVAMRVLAGPDPSDATSVDLPWDEAAPSRPLRVGILREFLEAPELHPRAAESVERAAECLRADGAEIETVSLPEARRAIAVYYVLASAEASSNLARFDGVRYGRRIDPGRGLAAMYGATRGGGFGEEVQRRILLGTFALSAGYREAFYRRALAGRERLRRRLEELWGRCELLLTPTVPQPAFALGEKLDDPVSMYASDLFTVLANVAGAPAISLPCPRGAEAPLLGESGETARRVTLPLAVQLMARPGDDPGLLAAARRLEAGGFSVEA